MSDATTCILVVNEDMAAIYDSRHGISRLKHTILRPCTPDAATPAALRAFAFRLISDFSRDSWNGVYDGLIILGVPSMLSELRNQLSPKIRKLLIAEIFCTAEASAAMVARDSSHLAA